MYFILRMFVTELLLTELTYATDNMNSPFFTAWEVTHIPSKQINCTSTLLLILRHRS